MLFNHFPDKRNTLRYRFMSGTAIGHCRETVLFKHSTSSIIYSPFAWDIFKDDPRIFIPGCSTVTQLLELYHNFSCALDEGMDVGVVYLNISKAFDKVWHRGLLFKLKQFGIQGNILRWFSSYLSDRSQRVLINGQFSG